MSLSGDGPFVMSTLGFPDFLQIRHSDDRAVTCGGFCLSFFFSALVVVQSKICLFDLMVLKCYRTRIHCVSILRSDEVLE